VPSRPPKRADFNAIRDYTENVGLLWVPDKFSG